MTSLLYLRVAVAVLFILCFMKTTLTSQDQNQDKYPLEKDIRSLDGIMKAYYEVVSGPAGAPRQIERDHSLHHPDAFIAITGENEQGVPFTRTMTLDEFHGDGAPYEQGFWEHEIDRDVSTFGHITHVWSTYAWSTVKDGPIEGRGINSIQLVYDGDRWWIMSWIYDSERANNPLPDKEADSIPEWFKKDLETHIGQWTADNAQYANQDNGIESFSMEWIWGLDHKSIIGSLTGAKDDQSIGELWQFRYYWDPELNGAVVVQYGNGGVVGRGQVFNLGNGKTESTQTFYTPGAETSKIRHQETITGNTQTSISYKMERGNWMQDRSYTWHRKPK